MVAQDTRADNAPMERRTLGTQGLAVAAVGLGCMSIGGAEPGPARDEAEALLHRALELGIELFDTADVYGTSEEAVGHVLRRHRDRVVVATKFGLPGPRGGGSPNALRVDGRPEYVRQALERSLGRLGFDHIDLYYQHRVDPEVPIEETVGAMAELVAAGKVRYLGLSEPGPGTIRRAHATHPISAIQTEWSLFSRDLEDEVAPVARELGIGLVPYSPLGRGFLTGALRDRSEVSELLRSSNPRYAEGVFDRNLSLVDAVRRVAVARGVTPGQVALAWVLQRGRDVVPIPGTRRPDHLEANVGAAGLLLDADELTALDGLGSAVEGHRSFDASRSNAEAPLPS